MTARHVRPSSPLVRAAAWLGVTVADTPRRAVGDMPRRAVVETVPEPRGDGDPRAVAIARYAAERAS